jgi:hypothetical protein
VRGFEWGGYCQSNNKKVRERRPTGQHVVDGFRDGGVAREFGGLGAKPRIRRDDEGTQSLAPNPQAFLGAHAVGLGFPFR